MLIWAAQSYSAWYPNVWECFPIDFSFWNLWKSEDPKTNTKSPECNDSNAGQFLLRICSFFENSKSKQRCNKNEVDSQWYSSSSHAFISAVCAFQPWSKVSQPASQPCSASPTPKHPSPATPRYPSRLYPSRLRPSPPSIWKSIPRYWGTPAYGNAFPCVGVPQNAFPNTGAPRYLRMLSHIRHPWISGILRKSGFQGSLLK
jgi:hypothetical protein